MKDFWTRKTADNIIIILLLLTAVFTILGLLVKPLSIAITIILALVQLTTAIIALKKPIDRKQEARDKTQETIDEYIHFQDATDNQKNTVIDRMRRQAPYARYTREEIVHFLESKRIQGERYAGLASIQWQWPNREHHAETQFPLEEISPPATEKQRDTHYLTQLLNLLCDPGNKHQHYYAIEATWGMIPHVASEQMQEVCERVKSCDPYWKSDRWGALKGYLDRTCKNP
jgi:hypothetical protein